MSEVLQLKEKDQIKPGNNDRVEAFAELERGILEALGTYSNVHRGSGYNSMVSTHLYEQARDIILEYFGLKKGKFAVIFCTSHRAIALMAKLESKNYRYISSQDIGLPLGINALAVSRKALPKGVPFQTGGGTTRLVSKSWVGWADAPDRFEAGTPAIVNVIAFAKALRMIRQYGKEIFLNSYPEKLTSVEILYHDELEKYSGKVLLDELRKTMIGSGVRVPTTEGAKPFINMDNSASTPTFNPIWSAFCHTLGQPEQVRCEIIHEVKSICSMMLGAPRSAFDIIFTTNTTEAINLTADCLRAESSQEYEPVVLNTILEHSSNDLPWRMLPGYSLIRQSVDDEGFIDLEEMERILSAYNQKEQYGKKRIRLVTVSGASNVLGVCNNIKDISLIAHRYGARLLVDAAQLVAHRKVEMEEWDIDYLSFSAHKIYAPFGCGALVYRKGMLYSKSEMLDLAIASGEENPGGIAALGKALILLQRIGMDLIREEEQLLTKRALHGMARIAGLRIYGVKNTDSPGFEHKIGVIVFSLKGMMSDKVAKELALRGGIGVRYGCHCAHIIIKHLLNISPFLERFQRLIVTFFPELKLPGLVRVSLGIENNEAEVDTLIRVLGEIAGKPNHSKRNGASGLSKADVQKQINDFIKAEALRIYQ